MFLRTKKVFSLCFSGRLHYLRFVKKASFILPIMARHNTLGQLGEQEAARYLMHAGYTLHECNWRSGRMEVDIIAEWYGEMVFVEVKTRSDEAYMPAADAVDTDKKLHLLQAARDYMALHALDMPYRFDIITVVGREAPYHVEHHINAFTPQGVRAERLKRTY